jgi:haloalkane dehalogenase
MTLLVDRSLSSRRNLIFATAGGLVLASAFKAHAADNPTRIEPPLASPVPYVDHRIPHDGHMIYAREYPGRGPAFVMLHGFPDNLRIYDYLVPYLTRAGRRVVVFDFLGFGQSEKISPRNHPYTFKQQVGDLAAVVDALKIDKFVPVGHDSGGPCATNYALDNPQRIAWLCVMNSYYAASPTLRMPDIIEVFANPWLKELADGFLTNPDKLNWLRSIQEEGFQINLPPDLKERFVRILRPILEDNFSNGAGPAFAQMCSQQRDSVTYNTTRLPEARRFGLKVAVIWGSLDPYLRPDAAAAIGGNFAHSTVNSVEAGHWLMIDKPAEVAQLMLSEA